VFSSIPLQSDFGDIYHAGYMFIGRSGVSMPYRHGFEQLATAFSGSLYQGMYSSFYAPIDATGSINYGVLNYPYPATLSSIHGGIGDFEHRFARVNFRKGDLLGFPGAGYQGDLLVQNGSWTDIIAAETSMKHYLSAKRGLFTVEAEYASWAKDIAMNDLLPVYWQTTNFKLTHDMKQVYAALIHPLAEIITALPKGWRVKLLSLASLTAGTWGFGVTALLMNMPGKIVTTVQPAASIKRATKISSPSLGIAMLRQVLASRQTIWIGIEEGYLQILVRLCGILLSACMARQS